MKQLFLSLLSLAFLSGLVSAQTITETFGSGANAFTMDFVTIGNPNNAADTTGTPNPVGSVAYTYNIGKYEVSRDMVLKASTDGGIGLTLADMTSYRSNGVNRPATGISWNEAARFVNYLNTSKGYQAAYLFDGSGNFQLWSSVRSSGNNLFRHKDAYYFLPSLDEWYKAAYGSPSGIWSNYTTASDVAPEQAKSTDSQGWAVSGGTTAGTAVYNLWGVGTADIKNAGGLSAYGTMAQGGNVFEWMESAWDLTNDSSVENRELRGGDWGSSVSDLSNLSRWYDIPTNDSDILSNVGFRVAMIPEPSSLSLLALGGVVVALRRRKQA